MAARRPLARNNHLEEAMALLIRNQAAFVEQIARNDQELLKLQIKGEDWQRKTEDWQRKTEDWQRKTEDWQRKTEEWQRKAEERFDKIEARLALIEATLAEMPNIILKMLLEQLPKAVKKEIGFTSPPTR
jgi:seryl-tRNA synthetase